MKHIFPNLFFSAMIAILLPQWIVLKQLYAFNKGLFKMKLAVLYPLIIRFGGEICLSYTTTVFLQARICVSINDYVEYPHFQIDCIIQHHVLQHCLIIHLYSI